MLNFARCPARMQARETKEAWKKASATSALGEWANVPGVEGNANACAFPFPPIGKFRATGFVPYREHAFLSSYPCGCKLRCDFRAQTLPTLVKKGCQLTNLTAHHTEQVPKTNACGKFSHNIPLLSDVTVTARADREG